MHCSLSCRFVNPQLDRNQPIHSCGDLPNFANGTLCRAASVNKIDRSLVPDAIDEYTQFLKIRLYLFRAWNLCPAFGVGFDFNDCVVMTHTPWSMHEQIGLWASGDSLPKFSMPRFIEFAVQVIW